MNTKITVTPRPDLIPPTQEYTVSISNWDMERVYWDLFSEQERKSCDSLLKGTLAQIMLGLTMVVYALEQDKELHFNEFGKIVDKEGHGLPE